MVVGKLKMTASEWRAYVRAQLERPRDWSTYFRLQLERAVPVSVLIAILASGITIYFWGFKEYARMVMQLVLGITLAAAIIGPMLKRLEQKFK